VLGEEENKMADKWTQQATDRMKEEATVGSFSAAAKRADKSTGAYAREVLANPDDFSDTTRRRAQFAENVSGFAEGGAIDVTHGTEDVPVEWGRTEMDWKAISLSVERKPRSVVGTTTIMTEKARFNVSRETFGVKL